MQSVVYTIMEKDTMLWKGITVIYFKCVTHRWPHWKIFQHEQRSRKFIPSRGQTRSCMKVLRQDSAWNEHGRREAWRGGVARWHGWWEVGWKFWREKWGALYASPWNWALGILSEITNHYMVLIRDMTGFLFYKRCGV